MTKNASIDESRHDGLVERAERLVPELRERIATAERLRRLPDENVASVRAAGLFKILQARSLGGYEESLRTHIDVVATLASGCAATGWCAGVIHAHSWLMGLFPWQAQSDAFGTDPDAIISAVISPRGTAKRVNGGYLLNGFWPFCSGCEHAQFLLLGGAVHEDGGSTVDEGDFLVPVADITIKDDWNVVGLRGTGSCSIVANNAFVPAHRYLSLPAVIAGEAPGLKRQEGWLYRAAAVPVLALAITPAALGIAEAALAAFTNRLPGREVAYTQREVQIDMPVTHMQVAEAATKISTARLTLYHCADEIEAAARASETMAFAKRARVRMDCAWAVRLCLEGVEILMLASGGSGISDKNPVQGAWRDLHAINMHGLLNLHTNQEMYGRVLLGLRPNTPLI